MITDSNMRLTVVHYYDRGDKKRVLCGLQVKTKKGKRLLTDDQRFVTCRRCERSIDAWGMRAQILQEHLN